MKLLLTKPLCIKIIQASSDGSTVKVTPASDTIKAINNILDLLISKNFHRLLVDFEDHMDSAAAISTGNSVADFRNAFLAQAILDCKN